MKVFVYYEDWGWEGETTWIAAANSKEEASKVFGEQRWIDIDKLTEVPELTANVDEPQEIDSYMD